MSRLENALLGENIAFGRGLQHRVLDPRFGGQNGGFAPVLEEWVSSALHRRHHVVGTLLRGPRAFDYVPDGERRLEMLKAIVERHPMTIDGLQGTLTASMTPNPVGGGGQVMNELMNMTEEQTNVVMNWNDRDGMPIVNYWREYMTLFGMDPHSKLPNIATLPGAREITDWLPDMWTFSMAFWEPNALHNQVVNAWVVSDLFPQSSGEILGSMDRQSDLNTVPVNITFGGLAQYGKGPAEFCMNLMRAMDITGAAPTHRKSFIDEIDADVLRAEYGYQYSMESIGRAAINN